MGYPFQILENEEVNIIYLLGNIQGWNYIFETDKAKVYYANEWYYDENVVPQIK